VIIVKPVTCNSDWNVFKNTPKTVYRNDPNWIEDQVADPESLLADSKMEVRQCREYQAFIAYDGPSAVGRIVAMADHRQNKLERVSNVSFGFYESVENEAVAFALLNAVEEWARTRSLTWLYGPVNPSVLYSAGMLIGRCGDAPLVGMPYNPEYYSDQVTRWGMRKFKDFHSYCFKDLQVLLASNRDLWQRWRRTSNVTFRSLDLTRFERDVERVRQMYNLAFVRYWGFTPIDREEFLKLALSFKPIIDKELVVFAELERQPVAFLMMIPDVNRAVRKASQSRIRFVRNLITLWHWKGPGKRQTMRHARADMLMVHPGCADIATAGLLIFEVLQRVLDRGYRSVEAAPVLEESKWMSSFRGVGTLTPHRIYRIFSSDLGDTAPRHPDS
jgi:hypothetical protein